MNSTDITPIWHNLPRPVFYYVVLSRNATTTILISTKISDPSKLIIIDELACNKYYDRHGPGSVLRITKDMILSSVRYCGRASLIFDGLSLADIPSVHPSCKKISARNCGLYQISLHDLSLNKKIDIRGNPIHSLEFNRYSKITVDWNPRITNHAPRSFPSLRLICGYKFGGAILSPALGRPGGSLDRCDLCGRQHEYCMEAFVYGFIKYRCCYKCSWFGYTPEYTVTNDNSVIIFRQKRVSVILNNRDKKVRYEKSVRVHERCHALFRSVPEGVMANGVCIYERETIQTVMSRSPKLELINLLDLDY